MIESIYIIDQGSGVPLFTHDLIETEDLEKVDESLFTGFLKVLDDFSKETRKESINEIVLASTRIIYEPTTLAERDLLLISLDNLKEKPKKIRKTLELIATEFEQAHEVDIKGFQGKVSVFDSFKERVQEIVYSQFGSIGEKVKCDKHPFKTFVSSFSKDKLKEWHKSKMAQFKKKDHEARAKLRHCLVKIFTPKRAFIIEDDSPECSD